ncbi:MAG: LCP family protein [Candidatus Berkelbacteria bacterium]|nr:LCP family protein [Candidatus Berkelbacteria bacterium]
MIDPIKKPEERRIVEFKTKQETKREKIDKHVYIEETKSSRGKGFSWAHFLLITCASIIVSGLFWGGLFVYGITKAKNQTITENYSGGAPAFNPEPSLPEIGENEANYDLVNILLLGNGGANHPGGALCDVIQVLSFNVKTKKTFMVSIPRDLFVDINGNKHKINEMYFRGEAKGKGMGGDLSKKITGDILGIPIHYYFKIDFEGFKKIVDTLEGIDVYVDQGISDPVWGYYINPGMHHFNGNQALDYVRSRESTSDFDRSARQQKTLVSMRDKAMSLNILSDPTKISSIIETMSKNMRTDITLEEMIKIFFVAKDIPFENMSSYVFDTGPDNFLYSTITRGGAYVILPKADNYDQIHEFIKQKLP